MRRCRARRTNRQYWTHRRRFPNRGDQALAVSGGWRKAPAGSGRATRKLTARWRFVAILGPNFVDTQSGRPCPREGMSASADTSLDHTPSADVEHWRKGHGLRRALGRPMVESSRATVRPARTGAGEDGIAHVDDAVGAGSLKPSAHAPRLKARKVARRRVRVVKDRLPHLSLCPCWASAQYGLRIIGISASVR